HVADELEQMGELQADDAVRLEDGGESCDEIIDVGDMGEHVVADHKVRAEAALLQIHGRVDAEETCFGGYTCRTRYLRHVLRGLDAKRGDAAFNEMTQQVAVIAGNFDHLRGGGQ